MYRRHDALQRAILGPSSAFSPPLDGAQRAYVAPPFKQVLGQTHQTLCTTAVVHAAQQKPAATPRCFALTNTGSTSTLYLAYRARPAGVRALAAIGTHVA